MMPENTTSSSRISTAIIATCYILAFAVSLSVAGDLQDAIDLGKQKRSVADMRTLATAILTYRIDHGSVPPSNSVASLRKLLEPNYVKVTPLEDAWGHQFRYVSWREGKLSQGNDSFLIIASGKDGQFETENPRTYREEVTVGPASDLVLFAKMPAMESTEIRYLRAPEWTFRNEQKTKHEMEAIASAVSIHSLPVLQHEMKWVDRELRFVRAIADHEADLRDQLGVLRAKIKSAASLIPHTPEVDSYLEHLKHAAEKIGLSIRFDEPEIEKHLRYQEITIDLDVIGPIKSINRFRSLQPRYLRLSSWSQPEVIESGRRFRVKTFSAQSTKSEPVRPCRPIDAELLRSDDPTIRRHIDHLEKVCSELDKYLELRTTLHDYRAAKDWYNIILALIRTYH